MSGAQCCGSCAAQRDTWLQPLLCTGSLSFAERERHEELTRVAAAIQNVERTAPTLWSKVGRGPQEPGTLGVIATVESLMQLLRLCRCWRLSLMGSSMSHPQAIGPCLGPPCLSLLATHRYPHTHTHMPLAVASHHHLTSVCAPNRLMSSTLWCLQRELQWISATRLCSSSARLLLARHGPWMAAL